MSINCKKCAHFYRVMATGTGYNPFPSCHLYENTGEYPNILTQECFTKRRPAAKKKGGADHDGKGA